VFLQLLLRKTAIIMVKVIAICCAIGFSFWSQSIWAQDSTDSISFMYSMWNSAQRKAILTHMDLTEPEKAGFYPLYDAYARIIGVLETERLHFIDMHAKHSGRLDEMEIQKVYEKVLQKDFEIARVRIQYHKRFRKVLSAGQANRFMALDESLRSLFNLEVQKNGPALALSRAAIYSMNARFKNQN